MSVLAGLMCFGLVFALMGRMLRGIFGWLFRPRWYTGGGWMGRPGMWGAMGPRQAMWGGAPRGPRGGPRGPRGGHGPRSGGPRR